MLRHIASLPTPAQDTENVVVGALEPKKSFVHVDPPSKRSFAKDVAEPCRSRVVMVLGCVGTSFRCAPSLMRQNVWVLLVIAALASTLGLGTVLTVHRFYYSMSPLATLPFIAPIATLAAATRTSRREFGMTPVDIGNLVFLSLITLIVAELPLVVALVVAFVLHGGLSILMLPALAGAVWVFVKLQLVLPYYTLRRYDATCFDALRWSWRTLRGSMWWLVFWTDAAFVVCYVGSVVLASVLTFAGAAVPYGPYVFAFAVAVLQLLIFQSWMNALVRWTALYVGRETWS